MERRCKNTKTPKCMYVAWRRAWSILWCCVDASAPISCYSTLTFSGDTIELMKWRALKTMADCRFGCRLLPMQLLFFLSRQASTCPCCCGFTQNEAETLAPAVCRCVQSDQKLSIHRFCECGCDFFNFILFYFQYFVKLSACECVSVGGKYCPVDNQRITKPLFANAIPFIIYGHYRSMNQ